MVRFTVLASGSKGNCTVLSGGRTRILVDAGLSCRELFRRMRLAERQAEPEAQENDPQTDPDEADVESSAPSAAPTSSDPAPDPASDPSGGRPPTLKDDPTWLPAIEYFQAGQPFSIGDICLSPFTIPHDAADPVGFVFASEGVRLGFATDLGYISPNVREQLRALDLLLLESNHDLEMLRDGPYPWSVKQRVLSRVGHLSNDAASEFLAADYDGQAAYIVLGHLSENNNLPELARVTAERALLGRASLLANRLLLAAQHEPLSAISF